MKLFPQAKKIFVGFFILLHTGFSMASGPVGPAATATLSFGSSQAKPSLGLGLGLYSVESPVEARMAPLVSLALGGQRSIQRGVFAGAAASGASKPADQKMEESHTTLYVVGGVAIVAVGALILTARHNAPATQGSGGTNPPQ